MENKDNAMWINVMWIDDEHNHQEYDSFIEICDMNNIKLIPFKTAKAGMETLYSRPMHFDAIILDAKAFNESENEQTSLNGMYNCIRKIEKLSGELRRTIPYYVFTGQADLLDNESFEASVGDHLYIKGNTNGNDSNKLIEDIKNAVSNSENIAIKVQFSDIFSWIPDEIEDELLDILKIVVKAERTNTDVFNKIRKILDWLMSSLYDYELLTKPYNGSELAKCSTFLGKKELSEFVPVYIRRSIHSCTEIANEGSHRLTIDEAVKSGKASYLVYSTVYELLNLLSWYHNLPNDKESKDKLYKIVANLALDEQEKPKKSSKN